MKHVFIINPAAGKGKAQDVIPYIKDYFTLKPDNYEIKLTEFPGHATQIAREYAQQGVCRIYSVGGDGTVNEIINGIAGTNAILGVIPTGSGNDFIRSIDVNGSIENIIAQTIEGGYKRLDLARVNDKFFINIASIGFDAEVVYNALKFKKVPLVSGSLAYILSIIYTVVQKKICKVGIEIDGKYYEKSLLLAAVANGRFYGGGMLPAPEADLCDGLFDICFVSRISRLKILKLFPKYMKGQHGDMKEVSFVKAANIVITSKDIMSVNIDGEIITSNKVNFEVLKHSIKVISPSDKASETYEQEQQSEAI